MEPFSSETPLECGYSGAGVKCARGVGVVLVWNLRSDVNGVSGVSVEREVPAALAGCAVADCTRSKCSGELGVGKIAYN